MLRILLVDDEAPIRNLLGRLLRSSNTTWAITLVPSGDEALALLRKAPYDVIVSDMSMPGMDGAALLQTVRESWPQMVRLVLSGHAEESQIMACVRVAHQFLGKPLDLGSLARVIKRATAFQEKVSDEGQRAMIAGLDRIPSPPDSYWRITQALEDPLSGLDRLASLVEKDPAVSVKLLQLVNSAYFGVTRQVSSIQLAVTLLGTELLRSLVFASHVIAALDKMAWASPAIQGGFEQILRCGELTGRIAQRIRGEGPMGQEAFAGGLFHDLGKLVAAAARPGRYEELLAGPRGPEVLERERAAFGFSHPEAGAYLLGLWGIPTAIVEAVAYHHVPAQVEPKQLGTVGAVHIAAHLAEEALGTESEAPETTLDLEWLTRLGLKKQLPTWRQWAQVELRKLTMNNL